MNKIKKFVWEYLKTFLISVIVVLLLNRFVMIPVVVEGTSMDPNLHNNDFGLSFILTKNLGLHRYDIVVVSSERLSNKLVKRIIGLPGEKVEYKNNRLYINGVVTEEGFLSQSVNTADFAVQLNDGEYFVLGDNREVSRDSRYYGVFTADEFLSTHIFVLWPFHNFGVK